MSEKIEGYNTFSNYDTIQFTVTYPSRYPKIKTIQINFGGVGTFDEDVLAETRRYKHYIKQFFHSKSKDGYFKDKFIFIDGSSDSLIRNKGGLFFSEVFLYLEEEYEKSFVVSYLKNLFDELNEYHKNHKKIKFTKYKHYKNLKCA